MGDLITTEIKKPELALLENQPRLKSFSETEINTLCFEFVTWLLNLLAVSDGKTEHHKTLVNHIKTCYKNYSIDEIKKAFELYVTGELGLKIFKTLDAVVFGQVMSSFSNYKNNKLRIYKQLQNKVSNVVLSNEEKDNIMKGAIDDALKLFKEKGVIELPNNKYNWLDSKGLLQGNRTDEEWIAYKKTSYKIALRNLKSEYESKKASSREEANSIKRTLKEIESKQSQKVIIESKRMILEEYFKGLNCK